MREGERVEREAKEVDKALSGRVVVFTSLTELGNKFCLSLRQSSDNQITTVMFCLHALATPA